MSDPLPRARRRGEPWRTIAIACGAVVAAFGLIVLLAAATLYLGAGNLSKPAPPRPTPTTVAPASVSPPWCNYPDAAAVAVLDLAVDQHVRMIQTYSPGQPIDRLTLQLDLLAQCPLSNGKY